MLEIRLFGPPTVMMDGVPLGGLPSRAAEAILIYLACQQKPVNREYMSELLWSERTPKQASANLRSILSSLRKAVGDYLIVTRQTLSFNPALPFFVDALAFETRLAPFDLSGGSTSETTDQTIPHLKAVIDLYRGDFLEGYYLRDGRGFDDWATLTRERLRRRAYLGMRRLLWYYTEIRKFEAGIQQAEQIINIDPYDEDTRRRMMMLYVRSGQPHQALRHYESLRKALEAELGVAPSPATRTLWEKLRDKPFPPPLAVPSIPTPFIGRDEEITEIRELVGEKSARLITLFGSGGIGKTRLVIEVAKGIATHRPGDFLDGIFFVPLSSVTAPQYVPVTIAGVIGVRLQGGAPVQEQLLDYLREREILLVLDNFEQLLGESSSEGVSLLVSILSNAPDVKILVTSRERLNLYEEIVFDVPGLPLSFQAGPDQDDKGAAALFRQTARRLKRDFSAEGENAALIVRVCRLLQGVPLAIELAASWVRQYSLLQIAEQIETSLDFLQTRFHNIPKRHQSLRAVFDHSWELLSPEEQAVFCQLPIFEGGFTKEALAAVITVEPAVFAEEMKESPQSYFDHWIHALADKSLLQIEEGNRFALHPLVRQFASEKQAEFTGVLNAAPRQHAGYYLDYLSRQESGEAPEHRAAILAEMINLRKAWAWIIQNGDVEAITKVLPILHNFYSIQSWFEEGIESFAQAADQLAEMDESPELAVLLSDLLGRLARMKIQIGQIEAARKTLEKAEMYLARVPSPEVRSKILDSIAINYFYAGEYEQAAGIADEILAYAEKSDNLKALAFGLSMRGSCAKALGDYALALDLYKRAVTTYDDMGDEIGAAMMYNNLGNVEQASNHFSEARKYYHQSTAIFKEVDHLHGAATALANEGKLALQEGDYGEASQLLREGLSLKQKMNDERGMAVALVSLGDLYAETGEFPEARNHIRQALELAHKAGDVRLVVEILVAAAAFWISVEIFDRAEQLLAFTRNHPALTQEAKERADNLVAKVGEVDPVETDLDKVVESELTQLGVG